MLIIRSLRCCNRGPTEPIIATHLALIGQATGCPHESVSCRSKVETGIAGGFTAGVELALHALKSIGPSAKARDVRAFKTRRIEGNLTVCHLADRCER
jgi:hypothetical protein